MPLLPLSKVRESDILESLKSYAAHLSKFSEQNIKVKMEEVRVFILNLTEQFKTEEIPDIKGRKTLLLYEAIRWRIIELKSMAGSEHIIQRHQLLLDEMAEAKNQ